ncbi:MAG: hypothetical protein ACE5PV_07985, partial [Candidatus Poribacteria bacterium]
MKRLLGFTNIFIVFALIAVGCVGINKTAVENEAVTPEGLRIPMVVTAEEANLYDKNTVIGKLPV